MNKSYKSVWNETTGTYVAASEAARSRGKSSRNQKALVAALLAAGVGFGTAVKSEAAATPNSYAAGIFGTDSSNSECISSADGATVSTNGDCSAPTQEAGIVSFDASGNAGSYFTVTDPNTAHIGAGGVDQMRVTNSGVFMLNTLDMGGKKITNLAAGSVTASSTDAVTGAQLYGVTSGTAVLNSAYIKVNGGKGDGSDSASVTSQSGIAIGINAHADTGAYSGSIAIGSNATASNNGYYGATALGNGAFAAGAGTAIGYGASATATYSVALGRGALANVSSALALGGNASATGNGAIAVGAGASATAGVALGQNSVATSTNTVSVGSSTQQRQIVNVAAGEQSTDAVNYGQLQAAGLRVDSSGHATNAFVAYDDTTTSTVTLGGASGTTLTNVAAGAVSASSKDAVNGSELYELAASGAAALGGGSSVTASGAISAPSYSVGGTTVSNVGAAITNLDARTTANASDIAQNANDIGTLNTQVGTISGEMADVVKYDTSAHDTVTLGGASGTTLTNVTAGEVSDKSTDAVNGSQLYATNQNVAQNTAAIAQNTGDISTNTSDIAQNTSDIARNTTDIGTLNSQVGTIASEMTDVVKYDTSAHDSVTLGGASGTTLTNVAAGTVSASSTDAVNGSQLYATNQSVAQNAAAIAQNTSDISTNASNIAQNTTDIDTLNTQVGTITGEMTDVVKYDTSAHDSVTLGGASGTTLTNLAAGTVSASSTDAVNGSQLYVTNQNVAQNTAAISQNTSDINAINSQIAGLGGGVAGAVAYDSSTRDKVTLSGASGTTLTNLAAGAVSASSVDAVNGSQLYTTNQSVAQNAAAIAQNTSDISTNAGNIAENTSDIAQNTSDIGTLNRQFSTINGEMADVVKYDTSAHDTVTLGGASGTTLTNVAAGALSASSTDAVNGSQLYATNQNVAQNVAAIAQNASDISTNASNIAQNTSDIGTLNTQVGTLSTAMADVVKYDTSAHDTVTLSGAAGTTLSNVKAGVADMDAVNVAQLKAAGLTTDASGNVSNSFVAYDDATKGKISLGGGTAGTTLTNVSVGALSASSMDAVNGSQLYATNQSVAQNAAAIAQNSSDIAQNASHIAQNASDIAQNTNDISNLDTRVTTVESSVSDLADQLNSGTVGLVQQDPASGALTVASSTGGSSVDFTGTAGARELLGVAAGTTGTSAVNLGQLSPVVASLGGGAQVNADGSITSPTYHMQGGTQTTVGDALNELDTNLTSLGMQINDGSIGVVTQDKTTHDINVGATLGGTRINMAGTAGNRVLTGVAAGAVGADSVEAVNGAQLYANAKSTANALGGGSTVNEDGTVSAPSYTVGGTTVNNVGAAIGNLDGRVTQNTSDIASLQTTVGSISGTVANAVSYDTSAHNQVTLGGSASAPKVKLTNLQDGDLSATSTDAVTGAQLWNTNQQLNDLSQSVQNQQQTGNQAMSLNAGSGPAAAATGTNAMALGGGSQASGENSVAIGSGSVADEANTVSVGSQGNERRVTNVANAKSATDAVNLGQMQSAIGDVGRAAYSGVAAATALTMIPEVDPGKTLAVGVAGATYKGYQAAAIGASARITQNVKVKVGAGISGSETTVGAGASYQW